MRELPFSPRSHKSPTESSKTQHSSSPHPPLPAAHHAAAVHTAPAAAAEVAAHTALVVVDPAALHTQEEALPAERIQQRDVPEVGQGERRTRRGRRLGRRGGVYRLGRGVGRGEHRIAVVVEGVARSC